MLVGGAHKLIVLAWSFMGICLLTLFLIGNDPQVFIYNLYYYMVYDIFCLGVKLFEVRPFLGPHKV